MLFPALASLDWSAVILGAVLAYIAGAVWYHQRVFGDQWLKAQPHRTPEDVGKMAKPAMVLQFFAMFMKAVVISVVFSSGLRLGLGALGAALWAGGVIMLFTGLGMAAGSLFSGEARTKAQIDIGYQLSAIAIIVLVHFVRPA